MREIVTDIVVDAPSARVWEILTDFSSYAEWNPFIFRIRGAAERGAHLDVHMRFRNRGALHFRPVVRASEPPRELTWDGVLFSRRVMRGEHRFDLESLADDRTRLMQSERFTGILIPVIWSGMRGPIERGFEAMNAALKQRAEGRR